MSAALSARTSLSARGGFLCARVGYDCRAWLAVVEGVRKGLCVIATELAPQHPRDVLPFPRRSSLGDIVVDDGIKTVGVLLLVFSIPGEVGIVFA